MKNFLSDIRQLTAEAQYSQALRRLESPEIERALSDGILNPELLTLKAMCIQLIDDCPRYELSDIERLNAQALAIDGNCAEALIELARYHYAIRDDAKTAETLFDKAIAVLRDRLTEAVIGKLKALSEPNPLRAQKNSQKN